MTEEQHKSIFQKNAYNYIKDVLGEDPEEKKPVLAVDVAGKPLTTDRYMFLATCSTMGLMLIRRLLWTITYSMV